MQALIYVGDTDLSDKLLSVNPIAAKKVVEERFKLDLTDSLRAYMDSAWSLNDASISVIAIGLTNPDAITRVATEWNDKVKSQFISKLGAHLAKMSEMVGLFETDTSRDMRRAALALDNQPTLEYMVHNDASVFFGQNNIQFDTILYRSNLDAVLKEPQKYALVTADLYKSVFI